MDHTDHQWYRQMQRSLQLSGKSLNTQESYLRSVRQVADHCGKDPQEISEQELSDYILFRRNDSRWKPATLRLCYAGLKFYYQRVLDRKWKLFTILHAEDERRLPVVLTQAEVSKILSHVRTFHNFTFLSTVYACGLRLAEALALTIDDIDAEAMLVHVRRGKGRADRTVPLPQHTLSLLRRYWLTHRNPHYHLPRPRTRSEEWATCERADEPGKRPGGASSGQKGGGHHAHHTSRSTPFAIVTPPTCWRRG